MAQHVLPVGLQLGESIGTDDVRRGRDGDSFDSALVDKCRANLTRKQSKIVATEEIHDVVQVAWSTSLRHRSQLLREDFLEGIAAHARCPRQCVRIWMTDV